ncbi:unnamed protein product [Arabidopsis lyrata]|uniref:Predicted protein n=1 Tax=Arabidopsis lyrata subsp. lyrata TaxID=81972 RepID=D7LN60_ARALL|nr:predicted protein [Arabidopsis lyrata subsp. lyrata]CAH8267696.1 unnamed protein product [Arabidopsis lyrata]
MPITNKNPVGESIFLLLIAATNLTGITCNPNLNSINPDTGRVTKLELMNK